MVLTKEQIAQGIGSAFATTFWQVIKDDMPKKFSWSSFYEGNRQEVKDKLTLYYIDVPVDDELARLQEVADSAFKAACDAIQAQNS